MNNILDSEFRPSRSNVESHSTAHSDLPGRMSSHTRQRSLLFQVQCRVTLDSDFCCSRANFESHSTALSAVAGRMTSHTRQRYPPFQAEYRVILDSVLLRSRLNVEAYSTALSVFQVEFRVTRKLFPLLQAAKMRKICSHEAWYS